MVNMEEYEGSPELDVDLELLSVYEKRLERAIRCALQIHCAGHEHCTNNFDTVTWLL